MTAIRAGDIVYIKTTGEEVWVLRIHEDNSMFPPHAGLEPYVATVRRPILTREGVQHKWEDFLVDELETAAERSERESSRLGDLVERTREQVASRMQPSGRDSIQLDMLPASLLKKKSN